MGTSGSAGVEILGYYLTGSATSASLLLLKIKEELGIAGVTRLIAMYIIDANGQLSPTRLA